MHVLSAHQVLAETVSEPVTYESPHVLPRARPAAVVLESTRWCTTAERVRVHRSSTSPG
jgi:hypothetical protein